MTYGKRTSFMWGGWSQRVAMSDGRGFRVALEKGSYVGRYFGNSSFTWLASVYDFDKECWVETEQGNSSFAVRKNTSTKQILRMVGVWE